MNDTEALQRRMALTKWRKRIIEDPDPTVAEIRLVAQWLDNHINCVPELHKAVTALTVFTLRERRTKKRKRS